MENHFFVVEQSRMQPATISLFCLVEPVVWLGQVTSYLVGDLSTALCESIAENSASLAARDILALPAWLPHRFLRAEDEVRLVVVPSAKSPPS